MHPTLFVKGTRSCIDLRKHGDVAPDVLAGWRAAYAKDIGGGTLLFATPAGTLLREKNQERESDVRLDTGWARKHDLYTPDELRSLIDAENRNTFDVLLAQLRSPVGVVPFVGAGLSVPFGFPSWPGFLKDAAAFHREPEKILGLIERNQLIRAADELYRPSPDRFQRMVERAFGAEVTDERVRTGPVSLLPLICKGPSITTNFDRVLESAWRVAGNPFDRPVTALEPDNVIRAMHRNEHVLIKMHGDALDRSARVFTWKEYQRQYGRAKAPKKGRRANIPMLARIMFTNRPLLFLGCSLDKDQTLDVLGDLHREVPGVTHYAILAAKHSIDGLRKRRDELSRYGITPLWFVPGDFGRIEGILEELLRDASTRVIWKDSQSDATPPAPIAPIAPIAPDPRTAERATGSVPDVADATDRLTRRLAERLTRGDLAFFLGAGIHLGSLPSARDFNNSLSQDYGFSDVDAQRAEVMQYLIDREGKPKAWMAARQKLATPHTTPSDVCRFLVDLPSLLRQGGHAATANVWLFTTNYDVVLEQALTARGEPFHLLSYQVDGEHEGRFVHRDLTGTIRIIERPENIRNLSPPASVVVKLDGGISWDAHIPETVAISPLDFGVSSGRLLKALPAGVRDVLRTRSLLVLGSSLSDVHVQRIVRWSAGNVRPVKTWAVLKPPMYETAQQFWPAAGVELVWRDLSEVVGELRRHLAAG